MLTYLLAVIFFLCFLHILFNHNYKARLLSKIPGPDGVFLFGNSFETASQSSVQIFEYTRCLVAKYPTISKLWAFPYGMVNLYQPEDIEILLATTKHNKKSLYYRFLESWLQDGVLVSYGRKWHQRRKILQPAFNVAILKEFCSVFEENSQKLISILTLSQGEPVDLQTTLCYSTLNTICETAMGIKLSEENTGTVKNYISALIGIGQVFVERVRKVHLYPEFTYALSLLKRKEQRFSNTVHMFTKKVVDAKRANGLRMQTNIKDNEENTKTFYEKRKNVAFLDLLLKLEKDGLIDGQGVHEEVNTFMFEGHDTVSSALTFALMLFANNKNIQENIVKELGEIFHSSDRAPTMEDFSAMRYLERCIKESLRLYPPVHSISRELGEETVFSGFKVPAGIYCAVQIFDLHRHEALYKDPLVFNPDRFLPENSVSRHPYAYIPFSAGPRNCIGLRFAMLEMKSVLSTVMRNFKLEPITTPEDLKFGFDIILKSVVPVKVAFIPRKL